MVLRKFWALCFGAAVLFSIPAWSQSSGGSAKSYTELGIANGQKGDYNSAIAAFDAAVEIDPKFAPAYFNRGFARGMQKDYDGAVADYTKTIELNPQFVSAYYQRGTIKGKLADFDAAITDFQQAIKLDPNNAETHYSLGHGYYFRGELDQSLTELNASINLHPDAALPYFIRGLILHAQGHRDESVKDFQKSMGLNFPYAAFWHWMDEMENGQHGLAEQDLTSALARPTMFKPDDWPSQIANFLLERITLDQLVAAAAQSDATEIKGQQCEAWFYGAVARHFTGDDKGANELFEKAVDTDSKGSEEYVEAKRWLAK